MRLRAALFQGAVVHAADLLPIPFTTESLDVLCANVNRVQDRLQRVLLVENLSAYLRWQCASVSERVWPETEFLSHAGPAHRLPVAGGCEQYLCQCPECADARGPGWRPAAKLPRLAGCASRPMWWVKSTWPAIAMCVMPDGDIVIDDHGSRVCDAVWRLVPARLQRFGAVPTLIEWDTDVPALDVLLDEADRARRHGAEVLVQGSAVRSRERVP